MGGIDLVPPVLRGNVVRRWVGKYKNTYAAS